MPAWTVEIPGWTPPSLNRLLYKHWSLTRRLKRKAMDTVHLACRVAEVPPATGKRRVSITVTTPNRAHFMDVDNIPKTVLDGLRQAGAILDDKAEFCALGLVQALKGREKGTVIILEDL
jgi:Holliday junction resolvase RusA-like endonuclease